MAKKRRKEKRKEGRIARGKPKQIFDPTTKRKSLPFFLFCIWDALDIYRLVAKQAARQAYVCPAYQSSLWHVLDSRDTTDLVGLAAIAVAIAS